LSAKCLNAIPKEKQQRNIIDDLNARNIRTSRGNPFNKNSLHRMFRNKRYISIYTYKDTEIPGGMPRILDDGLFYRVQNILERNKVAPARTRGKNEYLLTTKLFLGHCGEMMTGYTGTSKQGTRYHYYICNGRKAKRCNKKLISKSTIEESVIKVCLGLLTEEKIEIISDRVLIASNRHEEIASIKRLKSSIVDADHLWLAFEHGQSVEMVTGRIRIRKQEKEDLEKQVAKEEIKFQGFDYSQIRAYLYHIKNLPDDDLEKKCDLINIFINRISLYDDHYTLILNGGNRRVELENIPLDVLNSSTFSDVSEHIRCSLLVADAPPNIKATRWVAFIFGSKVGKSNDLNATVLQTAARDGLTERLFYLRPRRK